MVARAPAGQASVTVTSKRRRVATSPRWRTVAPVGSVAAVLLVGATLVRFGISLQGLLWAAAQLLLAFVACFDLVTRRVPNRVIIPAATAAFVLRAAFAASSLPEALAAGAIAFAFFLVVAVVTRGGMGMGDVKLASLIGLFLGKASVPARTQPGNNSPILLTT